MTRCALLALFYRSAAAPMLENVRSKLRLLRSKVTSPLTRRGSADIRDVLRVWQFPDKHRPFLEAHQRALSNYRPKPYPGPIILIRAGTLALCSQPAHDR